MERNLTRNLITLASVSQEIPYGLRFEYEDRWLATSVEKRGMLLPVLLIREGNRLTAVSGHRRFLLALRKGWEDIPAVVIEESFTEKERFLLSLYSNWNQRFSELDQMVALRKAEKDFGFNAQGLEEEVLPVLGVSPARGVLEEYGAVANLPEEIHHLIHKRQIPFRGSSSLTRFSQAEVLTLATSVLSQIHLTANQLILVTEWLGDLMRLKKARLEDLLKAEGLADALCRDEMDRRSRGERFFRALRSLRFPKISDAERRFERLKARFSDSREIHLDPPEGFETQGLTLRARLKDGEGVTRVLSFLEKHRGTLEGFLSV